jgi:hypothetical protein
MTLLEESLELDNSIIVSALKQEDGVQNIDEIVETRVKEQKYG